MFFGDDVGIVFEAYSLVHYILFICVILGSTLIIVFRKRIREVKFERYIAISMAVFGFVWEIGLWTWHVLNGHRNWDHILPLSLCAFTLFVAIGALLFKRYRLFEIGYFWTWGLIASVLFPDILYSFDRFRFYQFMIGHILIFYMYVYMVAVYEWYPTWQSWKRSCITLSLIVIIMIIASNASGYNLMFMLNGDGSPFEMFEGGAYVLYLLGVITMSFVIIFIWFVPWIFYNKKNKST